ncbi:MAG: aminotransferase class V-fold PLP-dependent enzyme [Actinobacteria bacterium]|nr:aminotransferase class V-fold PLP-dependent enzyme [Actinomycetota bacterium]
MEFDLQELKSHWSLDPAYHHVNHGSFGAVPISVQKVQQEWRDRIQKNPVKFFARELKEEVATARGSVARFLGQQADQIALIRNTTEGASTVMRGFPLNSGDEVIVLNQEYGAVTKAVIRACEASGAKLVEIDVDYLDSDQRVIEKITAGITKKTRLLVVDHITSATARSFPIYELGALCKAHSVVYVVDASHSPGTVDIDLDKLDADFWFGNLHKWVSTPLGVGVLRIAPRWQEVLRPLIVSWRDDEPYPYPWDMLGTVDPTSWLSAPSAIDFFSQLGWERVRKANHQRMMFGRELVMKELGISKEEIRADFLPLGVVPIHKMSGGRDGAAAVQVKIAEEFKVEVPISFIAEKYYLRISGMLYNTPENYEALAVAVRKTFT